MSTLQGLEFEESYDAERYGRPQSDYLRGTDDDEVEEYNNTPADAAAPATGQQADYEEALAAQVRQISLPEDDDNESYYTSDPLQLEVPLDGKGGFVKTREFMESWPKPSYSFIARQAKRGGIHLYCRLCMQADYTSSYVLCGGCGPSGKPAHRDCLARSPDHRPEVPPSEIMMGEPCQEIDFDEFMYTTYLLNSQFLDQDKESLHLDDLWSTWIGVPHDQEGSCPKLHIYPRLQTLIEDDGRDKPPRQYPSLISFVGDTGSGKSTLIRAIIRMLAPLAQKSHRAPVPGQAADDFDSTSSDIHLFADPASMKDKTPLLMVDCEGFSGSDRPIARQILSRITRADTLPSGEGAGRMSSIRPAKDLLTEHMETATHRIPLKWGQVMAPVLPSGASSLEVSRSRRRIGQVGPDTRRVIVKNLYPRLLYAFSDVVCFVTNNSRVAQKILEDMFDWAKDGHEKTLNQRVRPGLIIILNKMSHDSQNAMVDVQTATQRLLDSFQNSTRYAELKKRWTARGREITCAADLILCYYHDFRVISIPTYVPMSPTTAKKISDQIKILYGEIRSMSYRIRTKRVALNMNYDVTSLSSYLLQSVTSLSKAVQNTLDFHRLADGDSSLPRRFSEHLLQLLSNMVKLRKLDTAQDVGGECQLIKDLVPYIASCIVAIVLPGEKNAHAVSKEHISKHKDFLVDEARRGIEYFRDSHWRCEAKDGTGQRRCRNTLEGHEKGHQFDPFVEDSPRRSDVSSTSEGDLTVGGYISSYDPDTYTEQLWENIAKIKTREEAMDRLAAAATASRVVEITGQRTCLSCGIVALGVFEKGWSVADADTKFQSLATRAFSLRKALRVPILSNLAEPFLDHKYTSKGINDTLRDTFGDRFLFGPTSGVKVGVVSAVEGRNQPCLVANYSRNPPQRGKDVKDGYDWLQREDEQQRDFRTWQAARATSAAPIMFKKFEHPVTHRAYIDGATLRNNPVRLAYDEQKRIWPSGMPPDIVVSIGTGIHVDKETGRAKAPRNERLERIKRVLPGGLRKKVETGLDMVEATLDCHREWVDFKEATHGRLRENCHRLDVGLDAKPPPLDAVDDMQKLYWDCRRYLQRGPPPPYMDSKYPSAHDHILVVARRLLASVFYLEHLLPDKMKADQYLSHIHCRLAPRSEGAVSLLALKPQFRLKEVDANNNEFTTAIEFVNKEKNFDDTALSAPVHIKVTEGHYRRLVEVEFQQRKTPWEAIGGF
ncbi:hypothetical protein OQA88_4803 [Cercophora sp. LCS_1]